MGSATRDAASPAAAHPAATVLRLPELDERGIPGARLVRRVVVLTLGAAVALIVVIAAAVSLLTMEVTVQGTGTLEPARVWPVRAQVAGTVAEVLVAGGDTVRAGQALVRLDTLGAALALTQLEAQAAGQRVERERLTRATPIERRQAEVALGQATARVLGARAALRQRLAEFSLGGDVDSVLASHRWGTHVALDGAVADHEAAQGEVAGAQAQLARAALSPLDAVKQAFDERRLAAQVAEQRAALARGVMAAPAAGVVLTDQTERLQGAAVRAGETVLEVADVGTWRATLAVRERDVHRVRAGDRATVEIPALAALRDEPVRAWVVRVAAEPVGVVGPVGGDRAPPAAAPGAPGPGTYRVVLALDRVQVDSLGLDVVRRGYGVRARIVTRRVRAVVLVREWLRDRVRGGS